MRQLSSFLVKNSLTEESKVGLDGEGKLVDEYFLEGGNVVLLVED